MPIVNQNRVVDHREPIRKRDQCPFMVYWLLES
jgi:hypothetical protein